MISRNFILLIYYIYGILLPIYWSHKALKIGDIKTIKKWLIHWTIFAIYLKLLSVTNIILGFWLPFYNEIILLTYIWLVSPTLDGNEFLYKSYLSPILSKYEENINANLTTTIAEFVIAKISITATILKYVLDFCVKVLQNGNIISNNISLIQNKLPDKSDKEISSNINNNFSIKENSSKGFKNSITIKISDPVNHQINANNPISNSVYFPERKYSSKNEVAADELLFKNASVKNCIDTSNIKISDPVNHQVNADDPVNYQVNSDMTISNLVSFRKRKRSSKNEVAADKLLLKTISVKNCIDTTPNIKTSDPVKHQINTDTTTSISVYYLKSKDSSKDKFTGDEILRKNMSSVKNNIDTNTNISIYDQEKNSVNVDHNSDYFIQNKVINNVYKKSSPELELDNNLSIVSVESKNVENRHIIQTSERTKVPIIDDSKNTNSGYNFQGKTIPEKNTNLNENNKSQKLHKICLFKPDHSSKLSTIEEEFEPVIVQDDADPTSTTNSDYLHQNRVTSKMDTNAIESEFSPKLDDNLLISNSDADCQISDIQLSESDKVQTNSNLKTNTPINSKSEDLLSKIKDCLRRNNDRKFKKRNNLLTRTLLIKRLMEL